MSNQLFTKLEWLPPAPTDFKERCRVIEASDTLQGKAIHQLANHSLNANQLQILAKLLARHRKQFSDLSPLFPLRLAVLSDSTTALFAPSVMGSAIRHGLNLEIIETDYGQFAQEALSPESIVNTSNPDLTLFAISHRSLPFGDLQLGDENSETLAVENALKFFHGLVDAVKAHSGKPCLIQTIPQVPESYLGSFDFNFSNSLRSLINRFNRSLATSLKGTGHFVFDVAALAESVGLADWHDPVQWNMGKLPFSQKFVPLYADSLARLISRTRGYSKKCLVLDLDNTLWGGVIGDDGLEGIRLGQSDPLGEAYVEVQKMALALRERGIMIAVCSKNEETAALLPFQKHPEMLLKEKHISVFQANWNDKASNLKAIAEKLNIGTEALVFMDDNPAERSLVRQSMPEVAVPELPADPSYYTRTVLAAGYFETVNFSEEDRKRVDFYQANVERAKVLETVADMDSYLKSLDMEIHFASFDLPTRSRISQLINKSNQFNLTTKRRDESQVESIERDPSYFSLQIRLSDRFGDNGMISVIICKKEDESTWQIDTWLMSCRVLKRRVEEAALAELVRGLKAVGAKKIMGRYIPTAKNKLVEKHYEKLGFKFVEETDQHETIWQLNIDDFEFLDLPMKINRDKSVV